MCACVVREARKKSFVGIYIIASCGPRELFCLRGVFSRAPNSACGVSLTFNFDAKRATRIKNRTVFFRQRRNDFRKISRRNKKLRRWRAQATCCISYSGCIYCIARVFRYKSHGEKFFGQLVNSGVRRKKKKIEFFIDLEVFFSSYNLETKKEKDFWCFTNHLWRKQYRSILVQRLKALAFENL